LVEKLYIADPYCARCEATVTAVEHDAVCLDRTVFFPEGGGQLGDTGRIGDVDVTDTQKRGGHMFIRQDFPAITVGADVSHRADAPGQRLKVGDVVEVALDWDRRYRLMRLHSAAHFAYHFVFGVFGEMAVRGCRIDPESARFDFSTTRKLDADGISEVELSCNESIAQHLSIESVPHKDQPEALTWICNGIVIPCGGTHVRNTSEIGPIRLKRKRQGSRLERLYITLDEHA
jgi:alanyl-tRNA synthetase